MEWYDNPAPTQEVNGSANRVLAATSGNAQSFPLGSTSHSNKYESTQPTSNYQFPRLSRSAYPAPKSTLRSNDRRLLVQQKLNERRLKRRFSLAQKYLQHPKFLQFRNRSRKDVHKQTNEIIWDDAVEDAFQNAIVNIPGIGRKKKSQHGKTLGRNELIAEWIQQETGKTRTRKQVSSHIQTLDKLFLPKAEDDFPGIPEWRILTRAAQDAGNDADGLEFYDNSIADMVRNWKVFRADICLPDCDFQSVLPSSFIKPNVGYDTSSSVSRLEFEMWVGLPEKMETALHRYTRMQSSQITAATSPLEHIEGWRRNWPQLLPLIDNPSGGPNLDIILVDASFELMHDFPPQGSKLGVNLEIDFTSSGSENSMQFELVTWNCITYISQDGKLVSTTKHKQCNSPEPGLVKPPFESRWWAEQFTRLTEKRRYALDSGNDKAVEAADQFTRNFFKNLKIMQLVSTNTSHGGQSVNNGYHTRKTAVLLWTFSQAMSEFVGTTTWRKLIPPPSRMSVNSPIPSSLEMSLPPLSMDTNLESAFDGHNFETDHGFMGHTLQPVAPVYSPDLDEELCQDSFMMVDSHGGHNRSSMQFGSPTDMQQLGQVYQSQQPFQLDNQDAEVGSSQWNMPYSESQQHIFPSLFEGQENIHHMEAQRTATSQSQFDDSQQQAAEVTSTNDFQDRRHALLSFDVNTHNTLQAHLHTLHGISGSDNYRQTNSAPPQQAHANVLNILPSQLDNEHLAHTSVDDSENQQGPGLANTVDVTHSQSQQSNNHTTTIIAPTAIRPPLHHHHSFAGILRSAPSPESTFDNASRHDLSLLLDSFDNSHDTFSSMAAPTNVPTYMNVDLMRSQSQPSLVRHESNEGMFRLCEELNDLGEVEDMVARGDEEEPRYAEDENWVDVGADIDSSIKGETVAETS